MFRKKHHGPSSQPFSHSDDCKIVKADPGVEIPWSEVERGHWVRTCQCNEEHYRAPEPARVRLDPLDPATMRHLPQCEFKDVSDTAMLRALLRVKPGLAEGYEWVECGSCGAGWQVPNYEPVKS
jgi:hypothetical protein